jgi:DNA-binding transcriptional regulator YhcF (GntR family)
MMQMQETKMPKKELSDALKSQFKDLAKKNLEDAIKGALKMGLYYEDICEIVAKTINEYSK